MGGWGGAFCKDSTVIGRKYPFSPIRRGSPFDVVSVAAQERLIQGLGCTILLLEIIPWV